MAPSNLIVVDGTQIEATRGAVAVAMLNGTYGEPMVEEPIDFASALELYPTEPELVEEPDWPLGGTPLGI